MFVCEIERKCVCVRDRREIVLCVCVCVFTDERYKRIRETVSGFLEWNAYSRVDLSRVFPVL